MDWIEGWEFPCFLCVSFGFSVSSDQLYVPNIIPDQFVDETAVSQKVIQGVCPGATVAELDALAAQTAAAFSTQHPDYAILAGRIEISNLHRLTEERFSKVVSIFHHYKHPETGEPMPLVGKDM